MLGCWVESQICWILKIILINFIEVFLYIHVYIHVYMCVYSKMNPFKVYSAKSFNKCIHPCKQHQNNTLAWPPYLAPSGMVQSSSPVMPTAVGPCTVPQEEPPGSSLPSDTSDVIMDLLVQSVTKSSPRALAVLEGKRSRGNHKSLRRTLKSGLAEDLVQALGLSKDPGLEVWRCCLHDTYLGASLQCRRLWWGGTRAEFWASSQLEGHSVPMANAVSSISCVCLCECACACMSSLDTWSTIKFS